MDSSNSVLGQAITLGLNDDYRYTFGRNPNTGFLDFTGVNVAGAQYIGYTFNGNVGIGTSAPTAKLEISGFSSGAGLKLNYGNSSGTIEAVNFIANGGANGVIGMQMVSAGVGDLYLGGSGGRSLTLYRNGNVGIGIDAPAGPLHLYQAIGGVNTLTLDTGFVSGNTFAINPFITGVSNGGLSIRDVTNGADRLVIQYSTGNVGIGTINPTYKLEVNGSFAATTKSFVIDHPTKEGMKLRYGSLEGPENGVYVRGKLVDIALIELPDYWTGLVHADSITVNLTATGAGQQLYVERIEDNCVYIVNETGKPVNCFYTVYGERKDVEKLAVEID